LSESDYEIFPTYHFEHNNRIFNERINYVQLNICKKEEVNRVIAEIKPDYIYHLAGISFVPASFENPHLTYETNVLGTLNIYESIRKNKLQPSIVFVSTSEVYGLINEADLPIREERNLKPQNPYAVSKAAGELLSYQYFKNYGLDIKIARPFNHIGLGQSKNFVVPAFASQVAEIMKNNSEPVVKVGNIEAIRDFLCVEDVLKAYKKLVESKLAGEIFNICSGKGISIRQILEKLIKISGREIRIELDENRMRPSDNPIIVGSYEKIKSAISWEPEINIDKTLRKILDEHLK
jgi:GDP-4-dehydro-6-deoxy-D-mannose reductase